MSYKFEDLDEFERFEDRAFHHVGRYIQWLGIGGACYILGAFAWSLLHR